MPSRLRRKKKVALKDVNMLVESILQKHIQPKALSAFKLYGTVLSVQDGIIIVAGLKKAGLNEIVLINGNLKGMVMTLERDYVRICLMCPDSAVKPGNVVTRQKVFITIRVGEELLGRVVDTMSKPIDGKGSLKIEEKSPIKFGELRKALNTYVKVLEERRNDPEYEKTLEEDQKIYIEPKRKSDKDINKLIVDLEKDVNNFRIKSFKRKLKTVYKFNLESFKNTFDFIGLPYKIDYRIKKINKLLNRIPAPIMCPIERPAPSIMDRKSIHEPLVSGTKVVDGIIPIGRGQRELILGDRSTGKTTLALDAVLSQVRYNKLNPNNKIYSVYVAVGQRQAKVQEVVNTLIKFGAYQDSIVVFTPAFAPAILQFLTPYAGTTIAEYFRDTGRHALIIYDDLTKHAQLHRQLSLLLKTPPGREAYPGDVFYVHARLLERAAKLAYHKGSGSLTALPIIETYEGDATSYIPTNVISITDGQVYLKADLFFGGVRPAVNTNFSVSRVGSAAQGEAMSSLCGRLKLQMALYSDYKTFARFSSELDENVKQILLRGSRMVEVFKQKPNAPLPTGCSVLTYYCGFRGFLDIIPLSSVTTFENLLHLFANNETLFFPFMVKLEEESDVKFVNTVVNLYKKIDKFLGETTGKIAKKKIKPYISKKTGKINKKGRILLKKYNVMGKAHKKHQENKAKKKPDTGTAKKSKK